MNYSHTRAIPDRIPMPEKTVLPGYTADRVSHHTPNSSLHFHGLVNPRNPEANMLSMHGGHQGKETRVRDIPTFQSSLFTKNAFEKTVPNNGQVRASRTPPPRSQLERVLPTQEAQVISAVNTTYKSKFGVEGFARHHTPGRV